jgi:hypothetical protein
MRDDLIEKIRAKWAKFTRRQLEVMKGDWDELIGLIQTAYGCTRARAERELHDFQFTLRPVTVRDPGSNN